MTTNCEMEIIETIKNETNINKLKSFALALIDKQANITGERAQVFNPEGIEDGEMFLMDIYRGEG